MTMTFPDCYSTRAGMHQMVRHYFGSLAGMYGLTGSNNWLGSNSREHPQIKKKTPPLRTPGFFKVQWLSMFETPIPNTQCI